MDSVIELIQQLRSSNFRIGNNVLKKINEKIKPRKNNNRDDPGMGR